MLAAGRAKSKWVVTRSFIYSGAVAALTCERDGATRRKRLDAGKGDDFVPGVRSVLSPAAAASSPTGRSCSSSPRRDFAQPAIQPGG
jgi:hypothetical protein